MKRHLGEYDVDRSYHTSAEIKAPNSKILANFVNGKPAQNIAKATPRRVLVPSCANSCLS